MLKGTPEDREVYIALAQMYSRIKRWKEAEAALDKAIELSTKQEDKDYVTFVRGSIYERQKKYDLAEEISARCWPTIPRTRRRSTISATCWLTAARLDEALGFIRSAVALDPANGAYLDSLGWAYYKMGNYDLAEENLLQASQRIGTDPTVQDHLGDLYQKTGRLKLAATHWERAISEWNKTVAAEVDQNDVARVQKKLESAKMKLAKEDSENK